MWFESKRHLELRENRLFIGGKDAEALAKKYGTPLYVYNGGRIIDNYKRLFDAFKEHSKNEFSINYAMKANSHFQILKIVKEQGAGIDAVSPNEARLALKAGIPKEKIIFTGTSVSDSDLKELVELGVLINVDSFSQLNRLAKIKINSKISIRWNPGEGAGHHGHTITAGKFIKFGIPEDKIIGAFKHAKELGFNVVGLHQHIGSGWLGKDVDVFLNTVEKTLRIAKEAEEVLGKKLEFVDFGGGPGIPYKGDGAEFPVEKYAKGICEKVTNSGFGGRILIEPGRYIAGDAGILLVEVNTVEEKNIPVIGLNAGFNILIRPAFYGSYHEVVLCRNVGGNAKKEYMLAGNLCETSDVFNENTKALRPLPIVEEKDILAILCAGAYGQVMASNYNLRGRAAELLILDGNEKLITEKENLDDIISKQVKD
ncbi:MAG: diaminopimelate decarboxylase [Candidatus Diapherotrites archaeon]